MEDAQAMKLQSQIGAVESRIAIFVAQPFGDHPDVQIVE
jgi:hypothetical protein